MILAVDNGFHMTKTSSGVRFYSTIRKGEDVINNDCMQIKVNGESYIVGEADGEYISDADKLKSESTKLNLILCTLTAIGMSHPDEKLIDLTLAVGTPISLFSKQKDQLKSLMENLPSEIFINKVGHTQKIKVNSVYVYPQGIATVFKNYRSLQDSISMVIDIGGGSVDVSEFDGLKVTNKATYFDGMLPLYEKIAQFVNSNYYTNFQSNQIFKLIERGYFTVSGQRISMDVVAPIIEAHVQAIMTKINRSFSIHNVDNLFLTGGGAKQILPYIKKYVPNIQMEAESQFSNATGYEYMTKIKLER